MHTTAQQLARGGHVDYAKGALAGLAGGIVMAIVAMMITGGMGMGLFAMPAMIAGLVLGTAAAMSGGAMVVIVGLMLHMMLSAMFGVVFVTLVNYATHEFVWTGLIFGLALWVFNFYVIGAFIPAAHMMAQQEPAWLAIMTHAVFGISTGLLAKNWARP